MSNRYWGSCVSLWLIIMEWWTEWVFRFLLNNRRLVGLFSLQCMLCYYQIDLATIICLLTPSLSLSSSLSFFLSLSLSLSVFISFYRRFFLSFLPSLSLSFPLSYSLSLSIYLFLTFFSFPLFRFLLSFLSHAQFFAICLQRFFLSQWPLLSVPD